MRYIITAIASPLTDGERNMAPSSKKVVAKKHKPPVRKKSTAKTKGNKRSAVAKERQLAKAKGKEASALTKLKPIAKEINTRLEKADKYASDAFDHRLAAALRLEDARKMCAAAGLKFKDWAEANVTLAYETVRKLAAIGAAPKPRIALEDMREYNRKKSATARKSKGTDVTKQRTDEPPANVPSRTKWEVTEDMMKSLDDKGQLTLIESRAHLMGYKVVTAADAELLRTAKAPGAVSPTIKLMKSAFGALKPSNKMSFLKWAAKEVGAKIDFTLSNGADEAPIPDKGGIDVPATMRR